MEKKLYVGNLSYNTTQSRLEQVFSDAGEVVEATVIMDRETGRSKGFGFVEMADEAGAAAAIERFNGTDLDGRTIKVAEASPRPPRENRGFGGGGDRGGFGGGDRGGYGNRSGGDRGGRSGGGSRW
jgi:RNA recognition motif-containing protein